MHMNEQAESEVFEETEPFHPSDVPHERIRLDAQPEGSEDFTETETDVPHRRIQMDQSMDYNERIAHLVQDEFIYQEELSNDKNKTKSNEIIIE